MSDISWIKRVWGGWQNKDAWAERRNDDELAASGRQRLRYLVVFGRAPPAGWVLSRAWEGASHW